MDHIKLIKMYLEHFTPAFEDGTDRVFRNVGIYKADAGESPKRKQTTLNKIVCECVDRINLAHERVQC